MNAPFIAAASPHVMNTYGRLPIALSHGQGCRVWDVNGKSYLDALGGAVNIFYLIWKAGPPCSFIWA